MVCKHCGFQSRAGAKYCGVCGRELGQKKEKNKKIWLSAAACVLVLAIGLGMLFFRTGKGILENGFTNAEMQQVLPMPDGGVAVLYTDGSVRVSANSQFAEAAQAWKDVKQIYYYNHWVWRDGETHDESSLIGLTESGTVLTSDGSLSGWSNIKELHFSKQGAVGVTTDGRVLVDGTWRDEEAQAALTGMRDVESLVYGDIQSIFACLKKDGTVCLVSERGGLDPYQIRWDNVKEVRDSGHAFYVIKKDGTVDGGVSDDQSGLNGAVKVVHYRDWLFGLSADGRLLTNNGGNIYTNLGSMVVEAPGSPDYGGEVDVSRFDQVADLIACWGLIVLNKDGTVEAIGESPSWDLSDWRDIKQVCSPSGVSWENITLYGIKQDGTVIITRNNAVKMIQTVTDQYRGWKLQDIYPGDNGVVGLTVDGTLVGDGIYETVDFSIF